MEEPHDLRGWLFQIFIGATISAVICAPVSYFAFQDHRMLVMAFAFVMGLLGGSQHQTIIEALIRAVIFTLFFRPLMRLKGRVPGSRSC